MDRDVITTDTVKDMATEEGFVEELVMDGDSVEDTATEEELAEEDFLTIVTIEDVLDGDLIFLLQVFLYIQSFIFYDRVC